MTRLTKLKSALLVSALAQALLVVAGTGNFARAQTAAPKTFAELALYSGADREKVLLDGARKEGKVKWYDSFTEPLPGDIVAAYKAKYPGLDVEYTNASDPVMGTRIVAEYKAGRRDIDVITVSGVGPQIASVTGATKWYSPSINDYPLGELGRDSTGLYVTITQYARAFGYNTNLVKPADVPTKWEDLLNPRWKGKIAFSNSETVGPLMVGGLIDLWGRERAVDFAKKLGQQQIAILAAGPAAVASQLGGGDFYGCYCAIHHIKALQAKGAPVNVSVLDGAVFAPVQTTQLPVAPPNPHAALLFTDFLLAPDGAQAVLKKSGYLATNPKVGAEDAMVAKSKVWVLTPERIDQGLAEWTKIFRDAFRS